MSDAELCWQAEIWVLFNYAFGVPQLRQWVDLLWECGLIPEHLRRYCWERWRR